VVVDDKRTESTESEENEANTQASRKHERKIKVLVVEDEEPIRTGLCDVLTFHGFEPEPVGRGDEGLARARSGEHALVLLDVMLPGLSGFEVCQQLRESDSRTPVLMLTARGAEDDVLHGFRCGADDYVVKPFSIRELTARVEALLRRGGALEPAPPVQQIFAFGQWNVDPGLLTARIESQTIDLTRRDVEILRLFSEERGRIVSRRRLLTEIWGYPEPDRVETRSVDMHIAKLRKKLAASDGILIETVRGEGYRHPA
jgi:DNA-binding response OmpR family regulator